jgi:hypothetical protein
MIVAHSLSSDTYWRTGQPSPGWETLMLYLGGSIHTHNFKYTSYLSFGAVVGHQYGSPKREVTVSRLADEHSAARTQKTYKSRLLGRE